MYIITWPWPDYPCPLKCVHLLYHLKPHPKPPSHHHAINYENRKKEKKRNKIKKPILDAKWYDVPNVFTTKSAINICINAYIQFSITFTSTTDLVNTFLISKKADIKARHLSEMTKASQVDPAKNRYQEIYCEDNWCDISQITCQVLISLYKYGASIKHARSWIKARKEGYNTSLSYCVTVYMSTYHFCILQQYLSRYLK